MYLASALPAPPPPAPFYMSDRHIAIPSLSSARSFGDPSSDPMSDFSSVSDSRPFSGYSSQSSSQYNPHSDTLNDTDFTGHFVKNESERPASHLKNDEMPFLVPQPAKADLATKLQPGSVSSSSHLIL